MPREKLRAEIARIEEMGVEIRLNSPIDDVIKTRDEGGFDAVLLGIGAQKARMLDIPQSGDLPVLDALTVLRETEDEAPTRLHGRVLVYGGGNTAMDVARSALRLGALEVEVIYRGPRGNLSAHPFEIKESLEEGAIVTELRSIAGIEGNQVKLEIMVPGEEGGLQPSGQFETRPADVVVLAVGQEVASDALDSIPGLEMRDGVILVDQGMQTGAEGIFAAGDVVPSARTVTIAIGQGKKAARNIDAYLRKARYKAPPKPALAGYDKLNTWYYSDAPRTVRPMLDAVRRTNGFAEVVGDLTEDNALFEARRCMSCGNCFECDNCYGVCPDNSVRKLGPGNRFEFKYDYCKGCALCATECPCGAIEMVPEEI
jgi:NADPH-dependent glutamate synthase beta subunit-like oxidoreductase